MPTSPSTIATPPTAPARSDPGTFATRADAWVAWEETNIPTVGAVATTTYNNAVESATSATEAAASAAAAATAATSAGASLWVSGTSYAIGDIRRSPATGLAYRRLTAGGGTTDPSSDTTNWVLGVAVYPQQVIVTGTTQTASASGHYVLTNASATTVTLPASPAAGDVVWVTVANDRVDNVIARNAKNLMGLAEDMTITDQYLTLRLRYADATRGWRIV